MGKPATYTPEDLDLARTLLEEMKHLQDPASQLAWHFADVRNETIERCVGVLDEFMAIENVDWRQVSGTLLTARGRIRALKDGAK